MSIRNAMRLKIRNFLLGDPGTIIKDSYVWNMIGGMLNAGQSALLLVIISRTNSSEEAGIFSIAYAIACLALTVGQWGMRNFQSTDVQEKYSYSVYVSSRVFTCLLMLLIIGYHILKGWFLSGHTMEKSLAIFFMGSLKMVDAAEDIVHGMFQRKGRLDVGAKSLATRYIIMLCACSLSLILTHDLVISLAVSSVVSLAYFLVMIGTVYDVFYEKVHISFVCKDMWRLLLECFSLFLGGYLTIYIANAPKYAIDRYMDGTAQACFNYIFMPVYVISLLNMFIYQPVLIKFAAYCQEKRYREFIRLFFKQLAVILLLASVVIVSGFCFGIPLLSILYNTDLSGYKHAFMILLIGGSFLAFSGYFGVMITVLRKQDWLLIGYMLSAVAALGISRVAILHKGIIGAAYLYMGIMLLQAVIFAVIFAKAYVVICKNACDRVSMIRK